MRRRIERQQYDDAAAGGQLDSLCPRQDGDDMDRRIPVRSTHASAKPLAWMLFHQKAMI
jgi:hypothetical protein